MDRPGLIYLIIFLSLIVIWLYFKLTKEKKQKELIAKENAKLLADNAMLEADHLKFQLEPHTLNNILYQLKLTASNLNKGLGSLSETLEYILYKGNNHIVSVKDELSFIQEYLRLNELYIQESDAIKEDYTQVNQNSKFYSTPCIPHLISAYFIENAFKHGEIARKESLKITLKLTEKEFEFTVINRIKQEPTNSKGGLGLNNMKKRLEILIGDKYEIINNSDETEFYSNLKIEF